MTDGGNSASDASPAGPDTARRGLLRPTVAVPVALAVALVSAWAVVRATSTPSVSKAAVGTIADSKVRKALSELKAAPPDGVGVYTAVRAGLVIIESGPGGTHDDTSFGSGIIVDRQGQILTALHVVEHAKQIRVTFADGTQSAASVASVDTDHDVAVLSAADLPGVIVPAVLAGGGRVGDETFTVGNPLGLVGSLSAGVISGVDRSFPLPSGRTLTGLIQFDAAVNPGSSGGPLLNGKGQVIGIVTGLANAAGNDQFSGIGFAVPIATAGGAAGAPVK